MPFVKNVSDKRIVQMCGGINTIFDPGKLVPFKDRGVAIWHSNKAEIVASPADGRKGSRPLVFLEDCEVDDKELKAQATPDKAAPLPPAPSTFVPPKEGHVAKADPEIAAIHARKALLSCDKDMLIHWCKKHGVYQPYMDKPRMADALAKIGFKPPSEFRR